MKKLHDYVSIEDQARHEHAQEVFREKVEKRKEELRQRRGIIVKLKRMWRCIKNECIGHRSD